MAFGRTAFAVLCAIHAVHITEGQVTDCTVSTVDQEVREAGNRSAYIGPLKGIADKERVPSFSRHSTIIRTAVTFPPRRNFAIVGGSPQ